MNGENLTKEEKVELIRLLVKLQRQDMDDLGHTCKLELPNYDFTIGPERAGRVTGWGVEWYYSDGSCYPNAEWAAANNWDY